MNTRDGPREGLGAELTEDTEIFLVLCHIKCPFVDKLMSLHSVICMSVMEVINLLWTVSLVHVNFLEMVITVTSVSSQYMPFKI